MIALLNLEVSKHEPYNLILYIFSMYWIFLPNDWRRLKNLILALLKSGAAREVKRINYTKSYKLVDSKVVKEEQKLLIIYGDNKAKIETVIKKTLTLSDINLFGFWHIDL